VRRNGVVADALGSRPPTRIPALGAARESRDVAVRTRRAPTPGANCRRAPIEAATADLPPVTTGFAIDGTKISRARRVRGRPAGVRVGLSLLLELVETGR
jgi:hypothetical protein